VLIYWLLLIFFMIGALVEGPRVEPVRSGADGIQKATPRTKTYPPLLVVGAVIVVILIGLRYKVGGDWDSYVDIFHEAKATTFTRALELGDPGYQTINWFVVQQGIGIWLVNLVCAVIFGWGLLRFCAAQPRPWLAFAIAVPYLVIVVAMGYTRQAVALGILMAGLARQTQGASILSFAFYVAAAALFHSTAVIVFPIVAWSSRGSPVINIALIISIGFMFYRMFLGQTMDRLITNYIETEYSSQGALIRVSMNMVAAVCFVGLRNRLGFSEHEYKMWRNFSLAAFLMMLLIAFVPSSTAIDRISLYLMPLQIAVISRVPLVGKNNTLTAIGVMTYLFLVQFVWLNYAQFASYWVPYRFFPF